MYHLYTPLSRVNFALYFHRSRRLIVGKALVTLSEFGLVLAHDGFTVEHDE